MPATTETVDMDQYSVVDTDELGSMGNYGIACNECESIGVQNLGGPDPEDPDRHGNRRSFFECPSCGERGHVLSGPHGGTQVVGEFSKVSDADRPTPYADELTKQLVDRLNSHGLSADAVDVHNDDCVTVDTTGKTHRGTVQEMTPGLLSTARREGWYPSSIGFENETVTFRRDVFGETLSDRARR